ncbi:MAG: alpha/beta hydrolase family protein [Planctomycetota bacterium]|jgi:cephalosporin-C deacetylase-like acetyl esterase
MNRQRIALVVVCLSLALNIGSATGAALAKEMLSVLPETVDGVAVSDMMNHYLRQQARRKFEEWKGDYERRKTPEQVAEYQKRVRHKFLEAIGELPQRTPLKPRITGVVQRQGYHVEKVIFESRPKHYVTAVLFLPDVKKYKPPYPGVLVPCGHSRNGKGVDPYQTMGALLALNGMATLVFDPIDQGERGQLLKHWPGLWGTRAHTMIGVGSILLGRNTAWFEIWDGMRGIDYLQSRPEVDPNRIGCTGNSGGGTQTSYLMVLDERIFAAAPSCYITNFDRLLNTIGPQDAEQNIFGQLAFGMDHTDYLMMRAPKPTLICAATKDFFDIEGTWASFRYAKRLYTRLGFADRINLVENDAGHGYNQTLREAVVRWMSRWLRKIDEPITEPDIKLLSEKEIQCTPNGQVMLLKGARSVYDLNRDLEKDLAKRRKKLWTTTNRAELLNQVRKLAGIRKLAELPKPKVEELDVVERKGYRVKKMILKPEDGIYIPALMFVPKQTSSQGAVLYVHEEGKVADAAPGGSIEKFVRAGQVVLAIDLRGTGETQKISQRYLSFKPNFGSDWQDVFMAYLLGRSYVGMRADDVLICARLLHERQTGSLTLIVVGNVSVPALHAAALEPDMFSSVKLVRSLVSWSNLIELGRSNNQLVNTVHGALTVYDLPNLAETLGDKLTVEAPLNALGKPIKAK